MTGLGVSQPVPEYGRDYRGGYSLGVLRGDGLDFELGVDAQQRKISLLGSTSRSVLGRVTLGW